MNEEYSFGNCEKCGKKGALKYGKCPNCQGKDDMPDFFKKMFNMNKKGDEK